MGRRRDAPPNAPQQQGADQFTMRAEVRGNYGLNAVRDYKGGAPRGEPPIGTRYRRKRAMGGDASIVRALFPDRSVPTYGQSRRKRGRGAQRPYVSTRQYQQAPLASIGTNQP